MMTDEEAHTLEKIIQEGCEHIDTTPPPPSGRPGGAEHMHSIHSTTHPPPRGERK